MTPENLSTSETEINKFIQENILSSHNSTH